jgi:hypothetical protein
MAWFYLRDPYYIESISKDKQHLYKPEGDVEHGVYISLLNKPNALEIRRVKERDYRCRLSNKTL